MAFPTHSAPWTEAGPPSRGGWFSDPTRALRHPAAFSLIEVTIALSVAAIALLAILGLMQVGLTSQRATIEQTAATSIATMIYSDLTAAAGASNSPRFRIDLSSAAASPQTLYFSDGVTPTGLIGSGPTSASRYRATIDVRPPASAGKAPTGVRIFVSWPAAADPLPSQWPSKQAGAVDIWSALDRN